MLDGRAAGDPDRLLELGGDDHGQRRLAQAGRAGQQHVVRRSVAAPGRLEDQRQLVAHPRLTGELAEPLGRSAASTCRSRRRAGRRRPGPSPRTSRRRRARRGGGSSAQLLQRGPEQRRTRRSVGGQRGDRFDRVIGLLDRPAQPDQRLAHLPLPRRAMPWRRTAAAGARRACRSCRAARARSARRPCEPIPGTLVRATRSPVVTAARSASGLCTASIARASLGPTPDTVWTVSNTCRSSSSANPYSVSDSSRTTIAVASRACGRAAARRPCRASCARACRPHRPRGRPSPARPSSRSVGSACSCTRPPPPPAGLRRGERGVAGHQPGRARGLAHPATASPTRTSATCSSWCRPCPGVGPRLALAMLAVTAPTPLRVARRARRPRGADQVPGIGAQGCRAHRARAARQGRRALGAAGGAPAPPSAAAAAVAGAGAPRRWSASAGRPSRPRTPSSAVAAPGRRRPPTSPALLRGWPCGAGPMSRAAPRRGRAPSGGDGSFEATARVVDAAADDDERRRGGAAAARLDEFVGQARVREQLSWCSRRPAARQRRRPRAAVRPARAGQDHPGDDHRRRDRQPLRVTSGPAIQHAGDLAAILSSLAEGEVLFLDEIHRMARPGRGDALPGDGGLPGRRHRRQGPGRHRDPAGAPAVHRWSAPRPGPGCCPAPLRDRFGFTGHLDFYSDRRAGPRSLERSAAAARGRRRRRRASPRSPAGPGARPASPTGCCAGSATGPRCTADGIVDREAARRGAGAVTTSTSGAWTGSTGRCSRRCAAVRWRTGRPVDAGGRRGGGDRHRRDGRRAVPGARGASCSGRPGAGPPRRWPGSTWGWPRRAGSAGNSTCWTSQPMEPLAETQTFPRRAARAVSLT